MTTPSETTIDATHPTAADVWAKLLHFGERLDRIDELLLSLVDRQTVKDHYEIDEFARLVGREPFTCREWARLGRIRADKKGSGRGPHASWVVTHAELLRYQREGLLPLRR